MAQGAAGSRDLGPGIPLVGRDRERRLLAAAVTGLDQGGVALAVVGEAGMGKSAMLDYVASCAGSGGVTVVSVRGVECESVLPFVAAAEILLPMREYFTALPAPQREAIEVCLALSPGPGPGLLAACAGALGILAQAAERRPLVVLVDDLQWVDAESALVLSFVARRLERERVAMVFAVRSEPGVTASVMGLPVIELGRLSRSECAQLAARSGFTGTPATLASLVDMTGGNPLALLEALRADVLDGVRADRGQTLAAGRSPGLHPSLERTWGRLWDELPEECRTALFVLAASEGVKGSHPVQALAVLGLSVGSLAPGEGRGLISLLDDEIRLRHPLLATLARARTSLAVQAECHRALAQVADGDLRPWFSAAAALGPDPDLADVLTAAAARARSRNGFMASARMLHRAAELTSDLPARAQRLLDAATDAHLAGESTTASRWCEQALALRDDPVFAVDVARVDCQARTWSGDPGSAYEVIVGAAHRVRHLDPAAAAEALAESGLPAAMQGDVHRVVMAAGEVEDIWAGAPQAAQQATAASLALMSQAWVMGGELQRAESHLRRATAKLSSGETMDLQAAAFVAQSLNWTEQFGEARHRLEPVLAAARRLASASMLSFALSLSAEISWWTGQWRAAHAEADEALHWSTEQGQPGLVGYSISVLARLEAGRGNRTACQVLVERGIRDVQVRGVGCMRVYSAAELGLAALGHGDLHAATEHLQQSWDLGRAAGNGNPNIVPMSGDLAEALARSRQPKRCAQVIDWLEERADATGLAYPLAAARRAQGMLAADPNERSHRFEESLAALNRIGPVPFEQGRTLLCLGEAMRRARRPADARDPLRRAVTLFDDLGARPWADRARRELAASGLRPPVAGEPRRPAADVEQLSPQELQVARAVGRGLTNPEVAGQLFLSRKTVEAHLTRVYRRLGVRSRTELARLLVERNI